MYTTLTVDIGYFTLGWYFMPETRTDDPTSQGGWHTPDDESAVAPETTTLPGWKVPSLPTDISEFPETTGGWHRPRPIDTTLTPNDETIVMMPVEEAQEIIPDATPVAPEDVPPVLSPEDALQTLEPEGAGRPDEPLPEETEVLSPEDALSIVDLAVDDEEEAGVMTELLALNMLADEAEPEVGDAAAIAAAKVSELEGDAAAAADDPAEVARRRLAELEAASGAVADAVEQLAEEAAEPALTGAEMRAQELARRFSQTQEDIEQVRALYQQGSITPEQFEAELQNRMILDDDQIWWRMGAEDAAWYKYVNDQWTPAVPPLVSTARAGLQTERLNPNDPFGSTLPYIGDSSPVEQSANQTIPMSYGYTPLPNAAPVEDLDNTMVSPAAFRDSLDTPTIAGATVPIGTRTGSGSLGYGSSPGIESAIDESTPPEIDYTMPIGPIAVEAEELQRTNAARAGVLILVGVVALALIAVAAGLFIANNWYSGIVDRYEPQIAALAAYRPEFQTVVIQDAERREIARIADGGDRVEVNLSEISPFLIHAVISTRNSTFYNDPGWDTGTTISTWINDLTGGSSAVPSPTITQLVASNLVLAQGGTAADVDLVVVSGEMSQRYSKDFILSLFLNEFPFGNAAFGAEAASRFYFGKSAADLNLPEAALLAAIMENPGGIDPVTNKGIVKPAIENVFARMAQVGCLDNIPGAGRLCISQSDFNTAQVIRQKADVELRTYAPRNVRTEYPHFVNLVRQQLEAVYGSELYQRGFTVQTTLVPVAQTAAQGYLQERIRELSGSGVTTGAIMWTDPATGAIRAYIGSPDYDDPDIQGQRDYARDFLQPGHTIMPIVYATAMDGIDANGNGASDFGEYITAGHVVWDVPANYPASPTSPPFAPTNLDRRFYGPVSVREALANQYAAPATRIYSTFSPTAFQQMAERMGLQFAPDTAFPLSTATGETRVRLKDLMTAYGTIANGGVRRPTYAIESITDRNGVEVDLPDIIKPLEERALSPQIAFILQNILSDDAARNPAVTPRSSPLTLPNLPQQNAVGAVAGTNASRTNLWTVGFTSNAVVGVWLGTPDSTVSFSNHTGLTAAAPLWQRTIGMVIAGLGNRNPARPFGDPGGIATQAVCTLTGTVYSPQTCPGGVARNEIFAQNRLPLPPELGLIRSVAINTWTGLRASEFCANPEDTIQRTFVDASDPFVINWLRSTAGRQVAQQLGLGTSIDAAPELACDANTQLPTVSLSSPANGQSLQGEIQVQGQVSAPVNFNRWQLEIAPQGTTNYQVLPGFPQTAQQTAPNSVLMTWDTTTVPNGNYTLRLTVVSNDGGFIFRSVNIQINNPLPTPTPTPTITPTMFPTFPPFDAITSIPFDQPTPFGQQVDPFAQATPIPFGAVPTFGPTPTPNPF